MAIRTVSRPWNAISARFFLTVAGAGITGLSVGVTIGRESDGMYLQSGGLTWGASPFSFTATEVATVNIPGLYSYVIDPSATAATDLGYIFSFTVNHSGTDYYDIVNVLPVASVSQAIGSNEAVRNLTFNARSEPTSGVIYTYADAATALLDTAVDGTGADSTSNFLATYDQSGRCLTFLRYEV